MKFIFIYVYTIVYLTYNAVITLYFNAYLIPKLYVYAI